MPMVSSLFAEYNPIFRYVLRKTQVVHTVCGIYTTSRFVVTQTACRKCGLSTSASTMVSLIAFAIHRQIHVGCTKLYSWLRNVGNVKTISGQFKKSDLCTEHRLNVRLKENSLSFLRADGRCLAKRLA